MKYLSTNKAKNIAKKILGNYDHALELDKEAILILIEATRSLFQKMPVCPKIKDGSAIVVGDIHGDFSTLKQVVHNYLTNGAKHLIFLGDIVDRGTNSIACINLLLALVLERPKFIHILRGNHEAISVNSRYGFLEDVRNFSNDRELFNQFNMLFSLFPLALIHETFAIFFVHGGIPISTTDLEDIESAPKGDMYLDDNIIKQMLWNDPKEEIGRSGYSMRGMGIYTYGEELVDEFLEKNNLKMIIRAHEAFPDGFKYFFKGKLLSLFTSEEYYNYIQAKIAFINDKGKIKLLRPDEKP